VTNKLVSTGKKNAWDIFIGMLVFFFSLWLSKLYIEGDQFGYHNAYRLMEGLGLRDGFVMYQHNVSGAEYVHFAFSLLGSNLGIDKNALMSLVNGMLAVCSLKLLRKWGADFRVSCAIVLTNFYMFVLYFAAERLKFGFLFLVLSLLYSNKPWIAYSFSLVSIGSHFSMLMIYAGAWIAEFYNKLSIKVRLQSKSFLLLFLVLLPPLALVLYEMKTVLWKLGTYMALNDNLTVMNFMPLSVLILLTGVYVKSMCKSLLMFTPLLIGIAMVGSSRLNMMAYFIFLGFGLRVNAGVNAGVLLTSAYLFYKSIVFLANVVDHGHGFP
jgi:hypothetical protein